EGSVFFRKDRKKWIAQVTINGKPVTRSADTKEGAEELLLQLLRLVRQHAAESTSEQSLGQYLASWLERKRLHRDIRPHTYQCYVGRLRHVVDMIGTYPLEDLKPVHFTDAWTDL